MFHFKKKSNTQNEPFSEETFLTRLSTALNLMGFSSKLTAIEGYPLSIESKLVGYEDLPVDMVAMFLPNRETYGNQIRMFQIYISLHDTDLLAEQYPALRTLCNELNANNAVGCYALQEDLSRICYKQVVTIRDDRDFETSLQAAMDSLVLMALSLDNTYDTIAAITQG